MHCGIAFRRDFADRVIRAGPENSYDALVQFGNTPITGIVNLQWKREALENHNLERAKHAAGNHDKLLSEYVAKRQTGQKVCSKQRTPKGVKGTSKGVKWERPVCMQRKNTRSRKITSGATTT